MAFPGRGQTRVGGIKRKRKKSWRQASFGVFRALGIQLGDAMGFSAQGGLLA